MARAFFHIILTGFLITFSGTAFAETERLGTLNFKPLSEMPSDLETTQARGIASDIKIAVNGVVGRAFVTQYFYNDTPDWQEGIYTYPLPEDAAVDSLIMMVGNKRIVGFVDEKKKAREIYEQAKQNGQATSLVEQHRPNMFRNSVANIPPNSMVAVEIQYQFDVDVDGRDFSFKVPMAITPRYDRFSEAEIETIKTNQPWSDQLMMKVALFDFEGGDNPNTVEIDLAPGFELKGLPTSATHNLSVLEQDGAYKLQLNEKTPDRDFVLSWKPQGDGVLSFVTSESYEGRYYSHVLMVPPEKSWSFNEGIPARQVTFIIDTSGSMGGESMRQAKTGLTKAVEDLDDGDLFNIIEFNSDTRVFYDATQTASDMTRAQAVKDIDALHSTGGTEMAPAVKAAYAMPREEGYMQQIVFMTDGAVGYEEEMKDLVRNTPEDIRFHVVGIGYAPNGYLVKAMAQAGRGSATFINDLSKLDEQLALTLLKLKQPVLRDISLDTHGIEVSEQVPERMPDMFVGDPIEAMIVSQSPLNKISITAQDGREDWSIGLDVTESKVADVLGLHKLYARQKIGNLFLQTDLDGEERQDIVTHLGIEHQIVSEHTSLVAVDEEILRPAIEKLVANWYQPNLVKGWAEGAVTGAEAAKRYKAYQEAQAELSEQEQMEEISLPATATEWQLQLLLGLLVTAFSAVGFICARRLGCAHV